MKIIMAIFLVSLLFVVACAPQIPTTELESPEESEISSSLDDLQELDALDQDLAEDVTFEELDRLGLGE